MRKILKNKTVIITAIIVLLIGLCSLIFLNRRTKTSINKIDGEYYALQYDSTWSVKEKKDNEIILKHHSGSKIIIQISKLTDEYRYATMDELIDELLYSMQEQNSSYKLLSKKKDTFTKYQFEGYKLLYENDKEQVMVNFYKKSDKLITIRFEAENDYFDILLNSVHNIVYNLDIKEEQFNLADSIKLETVENTYLTSDKLDNALKEGKTYEIASKNYYVKYTLPKDFNPIDITSQYNSVDFKLESGEAINVNASIINRNIYEYLDKDDSWNVYASYNYYHDDEEKGYSDFKETLSKLKSNYVSYIYKNSYKYNKAIKTDENFQTQEYTRSDETAELIYALDNNHILIFKIKTTGIPITEKLVNMIKIEEVKNYASYVKNEKEGNNLIGRLKRFADYKYEKVEVTTLRIPDKYVELDKESNIYKDRYYGLNYDEEYDYYDYEVHYNLSTLEDKSTVDIINKTIEIYKAQGKYQLLKEAKNITVNGKEFKVYDGGFTYKAGILLTNTKRKVMYVNEKVLFYAMPNNKGTLYIDIKGYGKEITSEILNDLTNFTIEEVVY